MEDDEKQEATEDIAGLDDEVHIICKKLESFGLRVSWSTPSHYTVSLTAFTSIS